MDINIMIMIWFRRMFTTCIDCGTLINKDNAYHRNDSMSGLHSICKKCYIKRQYKYNNINIVKRKKRPSILINGKRRIFFKSRNEKDWYKKDRKLLTRYSIPPDYYSSRVGCTETWDNDELKCDECGNIVRYNNHGELQCVECGLIFNTLPIPVERLIMFNNKNNNTKNYYIDPENNCGTTDIYYMQAYSKISKKR